MCMFFFVFYDDEVYMNTEVSKNSAFASRLTKAFRESQFKTQKELADSVKITPQYLIKILKGTAVSLPAADIVSNLASVLGVSVQWLTFGEGPMKIQTIIPADAGDNVKEGYIQIPEYEVKFGAGAAEEPTYDEIEDAVPAIYRRSFFTSRGIDPKNCRRFHVVGDSMEPLIRSGDCITVDCTLKDNIENNQIYAIIYGHSLMVKRLIKTFKNLIIHSENPVYPEEILTLEEAAEQIIIVGKVIERSGSI